MSLKIVLIACSIIILLALAIGGVFIWNHWQTYQASRLAGQDLVFTQPQQETPNVLPEDKAEEEETATSTLSEQAKAVIEESQALIAKVREFLEEQKAKEALRAAAVEKASAVKGVYMTSNVANSRSGAGQRVREDIEKMIETTELNAAVIDIKEAYGPSLTNNVKALVKDYKKKGIWTIGRIVVFRDNSLIETNPELYLMATSTQATGTQAQATTTVQLSGTTTDFWRDSSGSYWLDPSSRAVRDYLIAFAKEAVDAGFDELQFDYIRFPSDGQLNSIIYPFYGNERPKYEVIAGFMSEITSQLKDYKPDIVLSVDIFGYVASQYQSFEIGQRTIDAANYFDYISFMLYPSHFFGGFSALADEGRGLPKLYLPYEDEDISQVVSSNPYSVVFRSLLTASDYLTLLDSKAKLRPWLQDFNLGFDTSRGIYYDAAKVTAQQQAVRDAGVEGWLFWNPSNVYTVEALNP